MSWQSRHCLCPSFTAPPLNGQLSLTVTGNDSTAPTDESMKPPCPLGTPKRTYGVHLEDHGPGLSTNRLFNVTVDTNNFSATGPLFGSEYRVQLDRYVGLYTYSGEPYHQADPSSDTNPRLLRVDVPEASSTTTSFAPLQPVPPVCSDPQNAVPTNPPPVPPIPPRSSRGSPRAKFKFSASDAQGAANIAQIQGIWSTTGSDDDGSGGPGGIMCQFTYDVTNNIVYLWDATLQQLKQSVIGEGGTDITDTTTGCAIHAGTSTSWVSQGDPTADPMAYVMDLTLDVTLPSTISHYHIYSFVQNQTGAGNFSSCGALSETCPQWTYSGYWSNCQGHIDPTNGVCQ